MLQIIFVVQIHPGEIFQALVPNVVVTQIYFYNFRMIDEESRDFDHVLVVYTTPG